MDTNLYLIKQNNSGGKFLINHPNGIGHHLIIEAESYVQAIGRLEVITKKYNFSCDHCGNRWSNFIPAEYQFNIYNSQQRLIDYVLTLKSLLFDEAWIKHIYECVPVIYIHYLNGNKELIKRDYFKVE